MLNDTSRSRLLLGISGKGLILLVSLGFLVGQVPLDWLPTNQQCDPNDLAALVLVIGCLIGIEAPLDVFCGDVLPAVGVQDDHVSVLVCEFAPGSERTIRSISWACWGTLVLAAICKMGCPGLCVMYPTD